MLVEPIACACVGGAVSSFSHVVERVCVPVISAWRKSCGGVCVGVVILAMLGSRKRCGRLCSAGFSGFGLVALKVLAAVSKSLHIVALLRGWDCTRVALFLLVCWNDIAGRMLLQP